MYTSSKLAYDSFTLTSSSLIQHLSSVFVSTDKELNTTPMATMSNEDAMYEEFRDELDDFVTVKN